MKTNDSWIKHFAEFLNEVDWVSLGIGLGLGTFILISLVRCALKD